MHSYMKKNDDIDRNNNINYDNCPNCDGLKRTEAKQCWGCRVKIPTEKACTKCTIVQPIANFNLCNGKPRSQCRKCQAKYAAATPVKVKTKRTKKWLANLLLNDPEKYEKQKIKKAIKRNKMFDSDDEEFNPDEYVNIIYNLYQIQTNCLICKLHTDDCGKLQIDHDHQTTKFRGLICQGCNSALGLFRDNLNSLSNAIEYLIDNKNNPKY